MKGKFNLSRFSVVVYWLIVIALLGLFFSNDFGLVDIHKTSIITAVGVDSDTDGEVLVTCEVAVPQPSQSGDNIKYTRVQGSGLTIADALNEVNSKTGFYPKLQFCKIILIGESCKDDELFRVLGCFYRKNYSELTALVAMCEGNAYDMLGYKSPVSDMTSEGITKALSEEIEKSANATAVNLKDIALTQYSKSKACYMPFVEANVPGTSENGGNGDFVGGESGNGNGGENGGQSGGGGDGGGESQDGESGQSGSKGGEEMEFTARRTAIFSDGKFKGLLDERQSFALAVLENDIRLAVLPCDAEETHYTVGLKNVDGGLSLKVESGRPKLKISFKASAQIQGARVIVTPDQTARDDVVPASVLEGAKLEMQDRFSQLLDVCREKDCDILGVKELLYKYNAKYFDAFVGDILTRADVEYDVNIISVN